MQLIIGNTTYDVDAVTSVDSLKLMIENREFVPAGQIRLTTSDNVVLEDGTTLEGNGVADDDEITLSLEVPAGMRKKWRKKRMRRLRRKRRKMRQRAR